MTDPHKLSVKEKTKVVQALWDDIAKEQSIETLPPEHRSLLDQRIKLIESGNSQFKPWSEVQNKYQKLIELQSLNSI
jgi:putative addiction module component (TIGR02574 family)